MSDTITFITDVSFSLSFIIALVFGIAQVRSSRRDRRERLTLEALRVFQTREFAELIYFISSTKSPVNMVGFQQLLPEEQIKFIQFGQMMENLGLMVADKYINIDLVDKTLGSFVVTTWEKYKDLYEDIRIRSSDPWMAEYFQWLAEYIDKRMKEQPREPFSGSNKLSK
jgi:hypothetical protein